MIGTKKEIVNWLMEQPDNTFEIKQFKKKRSLNANNYCWTLLQQLADKLNTTKEELYKKYIMEKGIFRTITVNNEAVNTICHSWTNQGLGWLYEVPNKGNTSTDLILYYGTSSYNSLQMSKYVDFVVEECKLQGIETMTPEQISELKERWNEN